MPKSLVFFPLLALAVTFILIAVVKKKPTVGKENNKENQHG
jgi:hypothetical protein